MQSSVAELVELMDRCRLAGLVNLDGRWGDELEQNLDRYDRAHPGRFATFCHVDWRLVARSSDAGNQLAASLRSSIAAGACGLKVWKDLGLRVRDASGKLILPDDERLSMLWDTAGDLGVPVLIHVADPVAFFRRADKHNERLDELRAFPGSRLERFGLPYRERLMDSLEAILERHPRTRFIGAHVASSSGDLGRVSSLLDRYDNLSVDFAASVAELGRQPRAARSFFMKYCERIVFGTDIYPLRPEEYSIVFRFLETADEYFQYSSATVPLQGRWRIAGIHLPDDVLERVYRLNARRLLPTFRND